MKSIFENVPLKLLNISYSYGRDSVKGLRFTISHAKTALFWSLCVKIKSFHVIALSLGGIKTRNTYDIKIPNGWKNPCNLSIK